MTIPSPGSLDSIDPLTVPIDKKVSKEPDPHDPEEDIWTPLAGGFSINQSGTRVKSNDDPSSDYKDDAMKRRDI